MAQLFTGNCEFVSNEGLLTLQMTSVSGFSLFSISKNDYLQLFSFGTIFCSNTDCIYITAGVVVDLLTPVSNAG